MRKKTRKTPKENQQQTKWREREKRRDKDVNEPRGSCNNYRLEERYKVEIIQQSLTYQKTLVGGR